MCDFINKCAYSKFVLCKQKVVPNGFSGFPYCYIPLTADSDEEAEAALDCGAIKPCAHCGTIDLEFTANGDHDGYVTHPVDNQCAMSGRDIPYRKWQQRAS